MKRTHFLHPAALLVLITLTITTGCSSRPDGDDPAGEKLPWRGSFIETAPTGEVVLSLATDFADEIQADVPEAIRREIADHIAATLVGQSAERWTSADPPHYDLIPQSEGDAYSMAGVGAIIQGDWAVGAWAFVQAVLSNPDDPYALNQLGWALLADGRLDDAKRILLRALELDPELWTAWSSLGTLYERSDDPDRASYCYQMGLQSQPGALFIQVKLGALLLEQGNTNGAALHAGYALAVNPESEDALALKERIEDAGGVVEPLPPPTPSAGASSAHSQVLDQIFDCADEHSEWRATALVPMLEDALLEGWAHRDNRILLQDEHLHCTQECDAGPMDDRESCSRICDLDYCSRMSAEITRHHARQLNFIFTEAGINAAYRARYRSCAYDAIEGSLGQLSHADATYLYEYVDWTVRIDEEADRNAPADEEESYQEALSSFASFCNTAEIQEAIEEILAEEGPGLGIDYGMEACLDGFICMTFGESSVGFELGVAFASGGLSYDYGINDIVFSLGVSAEAGVASTGVDLKFSIQRGIGLAPNVKLGGPIRVTASRDFWLLSF